MTLPALLILVAVSAPPAQFEVYDLRPFSETHPPLAHAYEALGRGGDVPSVPGFILGPDDLAARTGWWIETLAAKGRGDAVAYRTGLQRLARRSGAFQDSARARLADLMAAAGDSARAASLRWSRSPGAPAFPSLAIQSIRARLSDGAHAEVSAALPHLLARSLPPATRQALVRAQIDALVAGGERRRAAAVAGAMWWSAHQEADVTRAADTLKTLNRPLSWGDHIARAALKAPRSRHRAEAKRIKRLRARNATRRRIKIWADALLRRFDPRGAAGRLKRVERLERRLGRGDFGPWYHLGLARLLRRVDRDDEAVVHYLIVADRWPDHPATPEALSEAAGLSRALGDVAQSTALDARTLAHTGHGPQRREALWRLGLNAALQGDDPTAQQHLGALVTAHGGDVDSHALTWGERARYWMARSAERAGDIPRAITGYQTIASTYPVSWYRMLSLRRLGALGHTAPVGIPRRLELDTAVALARLGATDRAITHLSALDAADMLPGSGRALLAHLHDHLGQADEADRVRVAALVPAVGPAHAHGARLRHTYPLPYAEALNAAAAEAQIPAALLAGIARVETRFDPTRRSRAGAMGLCQVMPRTGRAVGRELFGATFKTRKLFDPAVNLRVAAAVLRKLHDRVGPHPAVLAAAFNAGGGPVSRWLAAHPGDGVDAFVERIPYGQARRYVMRVLSMAELYRELYDLGSDPLPLPLTLGN